MNFLALGGGRGSMSVKPLEIVRFQTLQSELSGLSFRANALCSLATKSEHTRVPHQSICRSCCEVLSLIRDHRRWSLLGSN